MQAIDIVKQYASAFNAHNVPAVLELFGTSGTYTDPVAGNALHQDGLGEYIHGLLGAFPDLQFELVRLEPAGDKLVVLEWIMHGTNTGPSPSGPASGRKLAMPGVDLITVEGDGIAHLVAYFDRMLYAEQMGLLPQEQAA